MPTTTSTTDTDRRRRRRIIGWGLLAFGAVAIGGAVEGITRAERDLERRVTDRLTDNGITGVRVEFSGQDGTLHCEQPLADPPRAERLAEDLWGVRVADLDRSCTARPSTSGTGSGSGDGSESATTDAATATTDDVTATTDDVTATTDDASGSDAATDTTEATDTTDAAPPTTDAAPTTTDAPEDEAATVGDLTVELVDGRLVLTGTVADEAARDALVDAAAAVVDPANIDDRLAIAGNGATTAGVAADDLDGLVALVRVMPPNLVAGTVTRLGDGTLSIEGTYADDAGRDAIADAADDAGVASADVALEERAEATASDAAGLTAELNDFVAANPIRFQPNSATLTPEASAVVDQVAAIANRYAGVEITVEGHTDTDGDSNRNFDLSAARALAVRDALIARGVTAPMEIAGLGETQPIIVDGVEDKAASRRVVFQVSAT